MLSVCLPTRIANRNLREKHCLRIWKNVKLGDLCSPPLILVKRLSFYKIDSNKLMNVFSN